MSNISISVASLCDKAGRPANQDNYLVMPDVTRTFPDAPDDSIYNLSPLGALMVVADGMGGMKSGEVASQIVVDTFKKRFAAIPPSIIGDDALVTGFIRETVEMADAEIKRYSAANPQSKGMGSTVVLCWIVNDKAFIAWTGDSRAYIFNPRNGLERLSHDHSYVQILVDTGQLEEREAFHHPQSNVIIHSVGDTEKKVHVDVCTYPIHRDDIILLCSDGLCGLLDDNKIAEIMAGSPRSMKRLLDNLWQAGCMARWTDNATIELMRIVDAPLEAPDTPIGWKQLCGNRNAQPPIQPTAPTAPAPPAPPVANRPPEPIPAPAQAQQGAYTPAAKPAGDSNRTLLMVILGALAAIILLIVAALFIFQGGKRTADATPSQSIPAATAPARTVTPTPTVNARPTAGPRIVSTPQPTTTTNTATTAENPGNPDKNTTPSTPEHRETTPPAQGHATPPAQGHATPPASNSSATATQPATPAHSPATPPATNPTPATKSPTPQE